ncbi:glycosyltransferase [Rhizobium sp. VS19-DR104.2]|uniref:glycosyltransferase family 2 protein n=1 Tax=unclassified Rhizobium TaxID=2613769 RepID=UPI001CC6D37B|nr:MULTISPECIES: glycosyltransferase family 2 protein [unclassified Rhizobium]MBZ5761977.1 glycosyltransferase [Rhizobium sp. VS19-DR96]MBZ5768377.1 glycosyltransferase [Rhizobium sp. VS19-DR129.2]MBZ5775647.1 glycosyltransferase [Rhizobium sp. VS19-DRK62.2]MBZ5786855.1 glycosyltransferase [Rhizobium sp. VS19-DR121]MBZ5804425.1 glycosyltransferase [Rhizobium sp. VS19-DR181]
MRITRILRPGIGQLGTHDPHEVFFPDTTDAPVDFVENSPSITIVVPSYNQGVFLGDTLKSIVDQQYPNLELIVVDGGSTDSTLDVIKEYESNLAWWISEKDSGQASAINKGFRRSSGEIMAWVNSDDMIVPGALAYVSRFFEDNPDVQVLYGNRIVIDEAGLEIGRWILPGHSREVLKWTDFVPQETLFWRRSAWESVGSHIDENFSFAIDWDFLLRLSNQNLHMVHVPAFLGLFRVHGLQKTSSQMSSTGRREMDVIRRRELGFSPTRWLIIMRTAPFLVIARWLDFRYHISKRK